VRKGKFGVIVDWWVLEPVDQSATATRSLQDGAESRPLVVGIAYHAPRFDGPPDLFRHALNDGGLLNDNDIDDDLSSVVIAAAATARDDASRRADIDANAAARLADGGDANESATRTQLDGAVGVSPESIATDDDENAFVEIVLEIKRWPLSAIKIYCTPTAERKLIQRRGRFCQVCCEIRLISS
jgi:hypothetical protein